MSETLATAVDISKALAIKGYMQKTELEWLAERAQQSQRVAEIGAYYGRSTRALCDNAKGKVHTFDDWWGPRDVAIDWRTRALIYEEFEKNLKDHLDSGKLEAHEVEYGEVYPEGLFDLIFIDGSHEYFDFKRDLERWIPALCIGGTIAGHDYELAYPGVIRGVVEAFGPGRFTVANNTNIWFATRDKENDQH